MRVRGNQGRVIPSGLPLSAGGNTATSPATSPQTLSVIQPTDSVAALDLSAAQMGTLV